MPNISLYKKELELMVRVIDNLSIYTTDDHHAEMVEEEKTDHPNWNSTVSALRTKLNLYT